jgi:hypothetical protein
MGATITAGDVQFCFTNEIKEFKEEFTKLHSLFYISSPTDLLLLSWVYGSVTNNNRFWIGWLDLLTPYFIITLNHNQFTVTHNTSSVQFWSDTFCSEPRLTWNTTVFSSGLSSAVVSWLLSSNVTDLVQSYFTNELPMSPHARLNAFWVWVLCYNRRPFDRYVLE